MYQINEEMVGKGLHLDSFDGIFDCERRSEMMFPELRWMYMPWNRRPSGEKVLTPRSVAVNKRFRVMFRN